MTQEDAEMSFIRYPDFSTYKGKVKQPNDVKEGFGRFTWSDGTYYEGMWRDDKCDGQGTLVESDGNTFEGEWKANEAIAGQFLKRTSQFTNMKLGENSPNKAQKGTARKAFMIDRGRDGTTFIGEVMNGVRNGKGRIISSSGSVFKGEFKDGKATGHGTMVQRDGVVYEGEWLDNKKHGIGQLSLPTGEVYEGGFFDDLKEGYGIQQNKDGSVYKGDWLRGEMHGRGELITKLGEVKEGVWESGILEMKDRTETYKHDDFLAEIKSEPLLRPRPDMEAMNDFPLSNTSRRSDAFPKPNIPREESSHDEDK